MPRGALRLRRSALALLFISLCLVSRTAFRASEGDAFTGAGHFARGDQRRVQRQVLASPEELEAAMVQEAVIVDMRGFGEREAGEVIPGAIHAPWDGATMPLEGLPADKDAPIILH
eukprot:TRINITY_DN58762_c0_g1_i1.p1 TRINITY_DN58762_c0_g1~~TRINITY_DN58762_c0_g1_i1.p1  ORF type:complete len:116 (+),score=26.22 TRINITY_DN58762_c0_g1_i1:30-377(+)